MHELPVRLTVNGHDRGAVVEPRVTLADFLREECGLTGTHLGCEHGACGACTVLLDGQAVRSCLIFAVQVDGQEVTTVEGIADADGTLSPIQAALRECHGLQCGFCTPGFVTSITALLRDNPTPPTRRSARACRATSAVAPDIRASSTRSTWRPLASSNARPRTTDIKNGIC